MTGVGAKHLYGPSHQWHLGPWAEEITCALILTGGFQMD